MGEPGEVEGRLLGTAEKRRVVFEAIGEDKDERLRDDYERYEQHAQPLSQRQRARSLSP